VTHGTENDRRSPRTPNWVKVFGIVLLVLVVLVVVLLVTGHGGPGRHSGGDMPRSHTGPPPGVTHEQP
jgi:hypothetical protein